MRPGAAIIYAVVPDHVFRLQSDEVRLSVRIDNCGMDRWIGGEGSREYFF